MLPQPKSDLAEDNRAIDREGVEWRSLFYLAEGLYLESLYRLPGRRYLCSPAEMLEHGRIRNANSKLKVIDRVQHNGLPVCELSGRKEVHGLGSVHHEQATHLWRGVQLEP